jgi:uncharacterized damage-inducible protein DinB
MDFRQHLYLMAGWNSWCYRRLYSCVDHLTDTDYRRDSGLFFKSVHGSLNHMLLVEQLWRARLNGAPLAITGLDQELETDRAALKLRLLESADAWLPYMQQFPGDSLFADFTYRNLKGDTYALRRSAIVHTMFTHGAHHRGQVTTALTQMGQPTPELDFPVFYLEQRNNERHLS